MVTSFDQVIRQNTDLPEFIAIEGPIGVGKTTLAQHLSTTFNTHLLLEESDSNPFLERFYQDPNSAAMATQLHFLFQRVEKLETLASSGGRQPRTITDFLIDKDQLFAETTLDEDEIGLYKKVYQRVMFNKPRPNLVIYLQAPTDVLFERVQSRRLAAERQITREYLDLLNEAYMAFFHHYNDAPLLIINASELDLAKNPQHYEQLVDYLPRIQSGRHYFNPTPDL